MRNGGKLRMNSSVNIKMLNESLNSKFDLANYFSATFAYLYHYTIASPCSRAPTHEQLFRTTDFVFCPGRSPFPYHSSQTPCSSMKIVACLFTSLIHMHMILLFVGLTSLTATNITVFSLAVIRICQPYA